MWGVGFGVLGNWGVGFWGLWLGFRDEGFWVLGLGFEGFGFEFGTELTRLLQVKELGLGLRG